MRTALLLVTVIAAALAGHAGIATAQVEPVEIDHSAFGLGTLTRSEGALPTDVWVGASPAMLSELLSALPRSYAEPAYLDLSRRLLLSPAAAPQGADDALAGAKLLAAAETGFYREAGELAEMAPSLSGQPALTKVAALSALLDGDVRTACARGARLTQGRAEPFFLNLRYLCYVDAGEKAAADLTLNLLRDQGALSESADRVFTALQTSGSLGGSVSPQDAFQYAAIQMLGAEVSAAAIPELPGSVLAAVVRDADADPSLRLLALERALSLGLIGASEGQRVAAEMVDTVLSEEVLAVATTRPGSVESASALAASLGAATTYDGFRARAALYTDALRASRPIDGSSFADGLALAAMAEGHFDAATRWVEAYEGYEDGDPSRAEALRSLLALRSGEEAVIGLPLSDPLAAGGGDVPGLVHAALAAGRSGSEGAALLVALIGLGVAAEGDMGDVREAVVLSMLETAGRADGVARRVAFDAEAAAVFADVAGLTADRAEAEGDPTPRVKPLAR